jgi:hypothetical protein
MAAPDEIPDTEIPDLSTLYFSAKIDEDDNAK